MSETLEAPAVAAVAVTALPAALLVGGAVLAFSAIRGLMQSFAPESRKAFENAIQEIPEHVPPDALRSPSLLNRDARERAQAAIARLERANLPPVQKIQINGLLSINVPYMVESAAVLGEPFASLRNAKTVAEAGAASRALFQAVQASHARLFTGALATACSNAMKQTGFANVEARTGIMNEIRVIGSDAQGRALVSEIHTDNNGDVALAAEVVGISDGLCSPIMDAFQKALAVQGVDYRPARRKHTGGICQLRAAQEFVRNRLARPTPVDSSSTALGSASASQDARQRRAQRLNQRKRQHIQ